MTEKPKHFQITVKMQYCLYIYMFCVFCHLVCLHIYIYIYIYVNFVFCSPVFSFPGLQGCCTFARLCQSIAMVHLVSPVLYVCWMGQKTFFGAPAGALLEAISVLFRTIFKVVVNTVVDITLRMQDGSNSGADVNIINLNVTSCIYILK